ncbi:MAG: oxygen-independent coproporphyrinogen III oxidase [Paludibacteraceae bacterium]|nr:oxygen-independent coproporphyrinogen III oxidase [Paludibacteraceae bacterium]
MSVLEKYNVSVPRYTSYPPANYFGEMDGATFLEEVDASNRIGDRKVSFYLHLPFCRRLCYYCGCNSYLMEDDATVSQYIEALHKEMDLMAVHLDRSRPISQIHYGGGTPTAISVSLLEELNEHILSLFSSIERPEISIECHPGYLSRNDWESMVKSRFNRFSIGVQDFDEKVLEGVGREPSALPMQEIMEILRSAHASVNMDFLYGLPRQTPYSFLHSIEKAVELHPDRLVTFSYGHVPWVFKRQTILEKIGLPDAEQKQQMYKNAVFLLEKAGYKSIGLDHFVLPSDELYLALNNGQLHRNFQGYCTLRTTGQVYALGVTGISQLTSCYAQNTKNIKEYIEEVNKGNLPIRRGYRLNSDEKVVKEVIETLMCNYQIVWESVADLLGISVPEIKSIVHYDDSALRSMAEDGIIQYDDKGIEMTEVGHPFVRNVAASLDPLMQKSTKQFSKSV